jgi:LmbE family N-acetylglucosaminyl deacetylase
MTSGAEVLMVIGAHAGDAEVMAGAVAVQHVHDGGKAVIVHLTLGERGHGRLSEREYALQKADEAQAFGRVVGAEVVVLPYKDSELEATDEAKLRVCDVVREYRPDVLITHWSGSIHRDHAVCTSIVEEALFYAGLPSVQREHPAHNVGLLCFGENWEDPVGFQPELYVDVGAAYETWVQAMRTYELFGGSISSFPYLDYYQSLFRLRGIEVGRQRAQAFMMPPGPPRRQIVERFSQTHYVQMTAASIVQADKHP